MGFDLKAKVSKKVPALTSIFIILSFATIFIYMIFSIIPGYIFIQKIRQDMESVSTDKALLDKIIPVFTKAKQINTVKFEPGLPIPERKKLDRESLPKLLNRFQALAVKDNLLVSDNKLDINFSNSDSDSLLVYLKLKGQLPDFRNFLISLISLPFFETFEKINIHTDNSGFNIFSVNLKVNIESKNE